MRAQRPILRCGAMRPDLERLDGRAARAVVARVADPCAARVAAVPFVAASTPHTMVLV
jgi:hypothetical protein